MKRKEQQPLGTDPKSSRPDRLASRLMTQHLVASSLPASSPIAHGGSVYAPCPPGDTYRLGEVTGVQLDEGTVSVSFHPRSDPITRDVKVPLHKIIPITTETAAAGTTSVGSFPASSVLSTPTTTTSRRLNEDRSQPGANGISRPQSTVFQLLIPRLIQKAQETGTVNMRRWCLEGGFPGLQHFNQTLQACWLATLALEASAFLLIGQQTPQADPVVVELAVEKRIWSRYLATATERDPRWQAVDVVEASGRHETSSSSPVKQVTMKPMGTDHNGHAADAKPKPRLNIVLLTVARKQQKTPTTRFVLEAQEDPGVVLASDDQENSGLTPAVMERGIETVVNVPTPNSSLGEHANPRLLALASILGQLSRSGSKPIDPLRLVLVVDVLALRAEGESAEDKGGDETMLDDVLVYRSITNPISRRLGLNTVRIRSSSRLSDDDSAALQTWSGLKSTGGVASDLLGRTTASDQVLVVDVGAPWIFSGLLDTCARHGTVFVAWNPVGSSEQETSWVRALTLVSQSLRGPKVATAGFNFVPLPSAVWDHRVYKHTAALYPGLHPVVLDRADVLPPTTSTSLLPEPRDEVDVTDDLMRIAELAWPRVLNKYQQSEVERSRLHRALLEAARGNREESDDLDSVQLLFPKLTSKRNRDDEAQELYLLEQSHETKRTTYDRQGGGGPLLAFVTAVELMRGNATLVKEEEQK